MPLERLAQAHADPAGRQLVNILRDQAIDRVPHHVDQLEPRQVPHHPLDRPGIGGKLGVMRARLAAKVCRLGGLEQRGVPAPASRVDRVVAEEVRLLGAAHEEARLPRQLLVQRGRGALHGPDHDEIRSMDHHPDDSPGRENGSLARCRGLDSTTPRSHSLRASAARNNFARTHRSSSAIFAIVDAINL